jgi:signal transduction histidine kinase
LDDTIRGAGLRLVWDVAALPPICGLDASSVFSIQRIVLEAVTNALKHSHARHLTITARARDYAGIEIRIDDDGRGFDASQPASGMGLATMRARARSIGIQLEITSHPENGTRVRLLIPSVLTRPPEDQESAKPDPSVPHELVPAPGSA